MTSHHTRPIPGVTYYAPIALASRWPLIFGERQGVIVDQPSHEQGVVYSTRAAAVRAFSDPPACGETTAAPTPASPLSPTRATTCAAAPASHSPPHAR